MSDQDTPAEERPRYVLYQLPTPGLEAAQRRRLRERQRIDALLLVVLATMSAGGIGMLVFEIFYGTFSTAMSAALVLVFAAIAMWMALQGNVGARGRFHESYPLHCVLSLEDAERERYGYGMEPAVQLDGIASEDSAEYLRLLDVATRAINHVHSVKGRLNAIAGEDIGPLPPLGTEFTSDSHVE